jgi:hypothetical protein
MEESISIGRIAWMIGRHLIQKRNGDGNLQERILKPMKDQIKTWKLRSMVEPRCGVE